MKPFFMVEDPAFIDFMGYSVPKWNIPSRGSFTNTAIPALETAPMETLKIQLKVSTWKVHLTTDIGSSRWVYDFVTVHWEAHDSKGFLATRSAVLDMSGFGEQPTANNIGQNLEEVMKKWLVPLGKKGGH